MFLMMFKKSQIIIGDSFYLSKIAKNIGADLIVFAGVSFMGESAKNFKS